MAIIEDIWARLSALEAIVLRRNSVTETSSSISLPNPQVSAAGSVMHASVSTGPVDAVLSDWSEWHVGFWSACLNGTQSAQETRYRTVLTPASNGGVTGPLSQVQNISRSCGTPSGTPGLIHDLGGTVNIFMPSFQIRGTR